jgi:PTS system cellobiose-specific IIB component
MKDAAKEKGIEADIFSMPISDIGPVIDEVDIILLGPQVRYQKQNVENLVNGRVPVETIDMQAYGTMDGKAVLNRALELINKS